MGGGDCDDDACGRCRRLLCCCRCCCCGPTAPATICSASASASASSSDVLVQPRMNIMGAAAARELASRGYINRRRLRRQDGTGTRSTGRARDPGAGSRCWTSSPLLSSTLYFASVPAPGIPRTKETRAAQHKRYPRRIGRG